MAITDITEVKDPSLTLTFEDRYAIGIDFQMRGVVGVDAWVDVLEWLSGDPYPSEANMVTWENARLDDLAAQEADAQTIEDETEAYTLTRADYVLAYTILNQMTRVFTDGNVGNPDQDTLYSGFVSAINGSSLEQPIRDKVFATTTLTNFSTPTNLEKERIMLAAEAFLQSLCVVGIVKAIL